MSGILFLMVQYMYISKGFSKTASIRPTGRIFTPGIFSGQLIVCSETFAPTHPDHAGPHHSNLWNSVKPHVTGSVKGWFFSPQIIQQVHKLQFRITELHIPDFLIKLWTRIKFAQLLTQILETVLFWTLLSTRQYNIPLNSAVKYFSDKYLPQIVQSTICPSWSEKSKRDWCRPVHIYLKTVSAKHLHRLQMWLRDRY